MKKKPQAPLFVYEAISTDIAMEAGGPMGSPAEENWRKLFRDQESAKAFCEKDYAQHEPASIKWRKDGSSFRVSSGDLGFVMYDITKVKVA